MNRTKWWLRVVGLFYIALVLMNVIGTAISDSLIRDTIPFEVDDAGLHAFLDAWFVFIWAIAALGLVALYASTKPAAAEMLVFALIAGELAYGVGGDIWLIARGYSAASYVAFSVLHVALAASGVWALRHDFFQNRALVRSPSQAVPAG